MLIKILKGNSHCELGSFIPKPLYEELRKTLSYLPDDYYFRGGYAKFHGDGRVNLVKYKKFGTGLLPKAIEFFEKAGHTVCVVDVVKQDPVSNADWDTKPKFSLNSKYQLRYFQREAIDNIKKHTRGLIQIPTGGGKSLVSAISVVEINLFPTLIVLMSTDLLEQTVEAYKDYLGVEIGRIGSGVVDIKPITIAMVQTLDSKIKNKDREILDYLKSVRHLIVDECHHQVADTLQKVTFMCCNAEFNIGMSGTPVRDNNDDMEIEAALGPIIYSLSISELIRQGFLVQPTIYMMEIDKVNNLPVKPGYPDVIKLHIENNFDRNRQISEMATKLSAKPDFNVLILVNRIEHGEKLKKLIPGSVFAHGNTKNRQEIFDDFQARKTKILIATSIIDEGWDCPNLSALILAHPYKSLVKCLQRLGRALRPYPGKEKAIIVDFFDDIKYLRDHARKRLKIYNVEPEFIVKYKRWGNGDTTK